MWRTDFLNAEGLVNARIGDWLFVKWDEPHNIELIRIMMTNTLNEWVKTWKIEFDDRKTWKVGC